jgi:hypothetical protein
MKQVALYLTKGVTNASATLTSADTTTWKTIYTASEDDAVLKMLSAVSDDTAAINLRIGVDIGGTVFQIATVNIPTNSGANGTANAVNLLNRAALPFLPIDGVGNPYLPLKAGSILKVAPLATMTAARTLTVSSASEEY